MIDLNRLREEPTLVKELILKKEPTFNVDKLIELDQTVKALKISIENLRKEKNTLATQGAKGITPELREKSIELGKKLKQQEAMLEEQQRELDVLWLSCPNLPQTDLLNLRTESKKNSVFH